MHKQIETLKKLREELNQESCLPKEPFMKLGTGNAPKLNYNLPQSACFSTYGDVPVEVNSKVFKAECLKVPENNYFTQVEKIEPIIVAIVKNKKLKVKIEAASVPNIKNRFTREV